MIRDALSVVVAESPLCKTSQITARLTDEVAFQLERAVALSGRSQTALITEAIAEKAREIEQEQYLLELSARGMDALQEAIANPPPPNEAMLRVMARWRKCGSSM